MSGSLWPELHATVLIGTARKPWHPVEPAEPLSRLVPSVGGAESDVLLAAGSLALARRAGVPVRSNVDEATPAPDEDRPGAPAAAARRLRSLMRGTTDTELLTVWLRLAADRNLVAPADQLPAMFELARIQHQIRPLVVAVAGARGGWLAAQRPEWRYVLDGQARRIAEPDERLWQEGTIAQRSAYLIALRDQDPSAGRDRLSEVWSTEPPAERAAFLATLAHGLSLDDEELCESALSDRRKEVRTAAIELLGKMPGSAYQGRMAARVRSCVSMSGRRLSVRPPTDCDAPMKRDGIEVKPPPGTGERAWWLEQLIAAAPLDIWSEVASAPARVLAVGVEPGWSGTLRRGWARAAVRSGDAGWAAALIASGFGSGTGAELHDTVLAAALYDHLPADSLVAAAIGLVADGAEPDLTQLGRVLDACPTPWPVNLANVMLGYLHRAIRAAHPSFVLGRVQALAQTIVNGLAIESLSAVVALADQVRREADMMGHPDSAGVRLMDSLVTSISVRYTMLQEFA
jgi:uncharacterized protein DUF5691